MTRILHRYHTIQGENFIVRLKLIRGGIKRIRKYR